MSYAGFWRRLAAYLIDAVVLTIGATLLVMPLLAAGVPLLETMDRQGLIKGMSAYAGHEADLTALGDAVLVGLVVLEWLYFAALESSAWQGTVGKRALGLRVTDLEGRRIGFGRASGRFLAKIPSAAILLIGFIMAAFTEKKQALHDKMAGTLVIHGPVVQ
jgi:uncharacterized RDD family membrane protein YckC